MNKNSKGLTSLFLVIAVVIIGIGVIGYLIFQKSQSKPAGWIDPLPLTPTTIPEDTANWKTHRNEEYGFEFMYPNDYFAKELVGGGTIGTMIAHNKWIEGLVHHPAVYIQVIDTKLSTDEWAEQKINEKLDSGYETMEEKWCMHCVSESAEETTVGNNIRALQYKVWGASGGGEYTVLKKNTTSDWLIEIDDHTAGSRDPGETSVPRDVFTQILSTFEFLD